MMILSRRMAAVAALSPLLGAATFRSSKAATTKSGHRVAVHVNYKDGAAMNMTLNNVQNLYEYFQAKGEKLDLRIVAHGPGLHAFREDTSPVKDRLSLMKTNFSSLSLAACGNTKRNMEKDEGKPIPLMSIAELVPSGVVELVLLEERGWSYLRP
jgi:intracellular sulfur oxidation DsrE/DsrF family protein